MEEAMTIKIKLLEIRYEEIINQSMKLNHDELSSNSCTGVPLYRTSG